jgi:hypothetical protein
MLSRALTTATVMLLIGCFTPIPVRAENLEAGKSPSQIFAGTCSACHKGTRGLIKTVTPGSLPGFLRQHYTTSPDMAGLLSTYLLSNGATDTRMGGGSTKQGRDAKSEPKPAAAPEQADPRLGHRLRPAAAQEAAKPDTDGLTARGEPRGEPKGESGVHPGRNARRLARPGPDAPETDKPAVEGQPGTAAASDVGPGGRPLSAKRKLGKRGRPGREEPPKTDTDNTDAAKTEPAKDEPSKGEAARTETPKDALPKDEAAKTGALKPADDGRAEAAKAEGTRTEGATPEAGKGEASRGETLLRADPVPAVTPAPPSEGEPRPVQTATPSPAASAQPATSGNGSELWRALAPSARPMPATEASAPPPAPVTPAGPPAPPISQ